MQGSSSQQVQPDSTQRPRTLPATSPHPVPNYFQKPQLQVQLKAQRGSTDSARSPQVQQNEIPAPTRTPASFSSAPQGNYFPFPFPASEHPLPPRTSPLRRPASHIAIPGFPAIPPQYFLQQQQQQVSSPPGQAQSLSTNPVSAPSVEYRFPSPSNPPATHYTQYPPSPASSYPVPPHYYQAYQPHPVVQYPPNFRAHGGGKGSISNPQVLTPFPPLPIRQLDSAPPYLAQYQTQGVLPGSTLVPTPAPFSDGATQGNVPRPPIQFYAGPPPGLPVHINESIATNVSLESPISPAPIRLQKDPELEYPISTRRPSSSASRQYASPRLADSSPIHTSSPSAQSPLQLPSPPPSSSQSPTLKSSSAPPPSPSSPLPNPAADEASVSYQDPGLSTQKQFTLPPPGGITPAIPRELLASRPRSFSNTTPTCDVPGCPFPRFCCLSPCGDMICRDHLGSVIRGVQLRTKKIRVNLGPGRGRGGEEKEKQEGGGGGGGGAGEEETETIVKVYECVKCKMQSEMASPTLSQQRDRNNRRNSTASSWFGYSEGTVGLGLDLGEPAGGPGGPGGGNESFSIHYFSSGPSGFSSGPSVGGGGYEVKRSSLAPLEVEVSTSDQRQYERQGLHPIVSLGQGQSYGVYNVPLVPKPPSPPYPLELFARPSIDSSYSAAEESGGGRRADHVRTFYQTPRANSGPLDEAGADPLQETVVQGEAKSSDLGTSSDTRDACEELAAPSLPGQLSIVDMPEQFEAQSIEPLLPSPPITTNRTLPDSSTSHPHHATLQDAVHLVEEDPSILCVSTSPPRTPLRESRSFPLSSPEFSFSALPSPAPTSDYFANYSFMPRAEKFRGTRGNRGSRGGRARGRGYDPAIHGPYRSPPPMRHRPRLSSFSNPIEEEEYTYPRASEEETIKVVEPSEPSKEVPSSEAKPVKPELVGPFPTVKFENIPFDVTYREILEWIPRAPDLLPPFEECPQPLHLILHRMTGRTLPHCYIEVKDRAAATELISSHDCAMLGSRIVRVKMERSGEFLRDLFDQSQYFVPAKWLKNLALAPLPPFSSVNYKLPEPLLTTQDLAALEDCFETPPWLRIVKRPKPTERGYTTMGSILSRFPWKARPDLWNEELRDRLFVITCHAVAWANETKGYLDQDFGPIAQRLVETIAKCPGFTQAQRDHYTFFSFYEFPPLIPATSLNSGLDEVPSLAKIDNAPSSESTGSWYPPSSPSNDLKGQEVLSTVGTGSIPAPVASLEPSSPGRRKKDRVEGSSAPSPTGLRRETVATTETEPAPTTLSGQPPLSLVPYGLSSSKFAPFLATVPAPAPGVSQGRNPSYVPNTKASWVDVSTVPATPVYRSPSPTPSLPSVDYPLTPPESPEATRPRFSKGKNASSDARQGKGWKT
ncbi:hypothetical protein JCM16303_006443 [Sporobolomyces ruberrimus]